ncbi:MAG: N-acetylmuramoyl-L-alanine amidase family protein [Eubacteriales bacterium]
MTKITDSLLSPGTPGRPGTVRQKRYIVIHETGTFTKGADAWAHARSLANASKTESISWHYTVDEKSIYHHLPDEEVAWHAGDGNKSDGGNMTGIALELCVNEDGNFSATLKNAAQLTAYLLKKHGLDIKDVVQHNFFKSSKYPNGKNCPYIIRRDGRWDEFLSLASLALTDSEPDIHWAQPYLEKLAAAGIVQDKESWRDLDEPVSKGTLLALVSKALRL